MKKIIVTTTVSPVLEASEKYSKMDNKNLEDSIKSILKRL
jgi:hypothetical protein